MSQPDSYQAMRGQFVELCVKMAPKVLASERRCNAGAEFDLFCGDVRIVRAALVPDGFAYVTTPLVMDGNEGARWAGQFAVKIHTSNAAIQCRSLERPASNAQHPHVAAISFAPCLSDNAAVVAKLRGDGKLARLAMFMVEFLESYDSYSAYSGDVSDWKPLTAEEDVEWKKGR